MKLDRFGLVVWLGVWMVAGCVGVQGSAPARGTLTATFTQTRWPPTVTVAPTWTATATMTPTVTPSPTPRWGAMWEEDACPFRLSSLPRFAEGKGDTDRRWYGIWGEPLRPVKVGPKRWVPLEFAPGFESIWANDWIARPVIVDEPGKKYSGLWLYATPWGALGDRIETIWGEKRLHHPKYWVVMYDWEENALYCLRWRGGEGREDLGPMQLFAGPWGAVLWDPYGGKMYGLRGRNLEVAWEAPYRSVAWKVDETGSYIDVGTPDWMGVIWNMWVNDKRGEEVKWTLEGYEVATGRHWFVRLEPRPWGRDWMMRDLKYSWDYRQVAMLQMGIFGKIQYRLLVYPLAECEAEGEDVCRPRVYPLSRIHRDWDAACQRATEIFWDPDGERLYLVTGAPPAPPAPCAWPGSRLWALTLADGRWRRIRLRPTEEVMDYIRQWHRWDGELTYRKWASYLNPVAWDLKAGKRLLLGIPLRERTLYAWVYLDEEREGEMTLLHPEEIPFGLVLPEK